MRPQRRMRSVALRLKWPLPRCPTKLGPPAETMRLREPRTEIDKRFSSRRLLILRMVLHASCAASVCHVSPVS